MKALIAGSLTCICCFLLATAVAAQSEDENIRFSVKGAPIISDLELKPDTLAKNRINTVEMSFRFEDERKDLRGGMLNVNFASSDGSTKFFTYPLDDKKFRKRKGKYSIVFGTHPGKKKWIDVMIWASDSKGNASNDSRWVEMTRGKREKGKQGNKLGRTAYDFTLLNKKGKKVSLSDYRGKVVIIDFSTMWCGPCKSEIAHLRQLYNQYVQDGLMVLSVLIQDTSFNPPDKGDCKDWAKTYKLKFQVLADVFEGVYKVYTNNSSSIPWTFIVDRKGKLRWIRLGFTEAIASEMDSKVLQLLNE